MTSARADASLSDETFYGEILASILQRFIHLVGEPTALKLARRVPELVIDHHGHVLDYNRDDPVGCIQRLLDEYAAVFGERGVNFAAHTEWSIASLSGGQGAAKAENTAHGLSLVRILIVDDHVLFRGGLVRLLDAQPNFTVVGEAGTAQDAIRLARETRPDIVLMDITLPDATGLSITQDILAESPTLKIVFLTVHEDNEHLFAGIRAGAVGYLSKGIGAAELISCLNDVARGEAAISPVMARRILEEFSRLPNQPEDGSEEALELTAREIEILRAVARGESNRQIAEQFFISEHTVKNHVKHVLAKLHLHSRRDAAHYARRHGLAPPLSDSEE